MQISRSFVILDRPKKSIQQCFIIQGASRNEVYSDGKKFSKNKGISSWNIYTDNSDEQLLYWAGQLHRDILKRYHPDKHLSLKSLWEFKTKEINQAYQRIQKIIKNRSILFMPNRRSK